MPRTRVRAAAAGLLGILSLLPGGCVAPPEYVAADQLYFQDHPREVLAAYRAAEEDPSVNALVGIDKMLSAAVLAGDWGQAERLAEVASSRVNIFLAGQAGEQDALSFLGREKSKPFKGEPHERAMVDFYLGLLRYRRGDFEGALNGFLSAMAKDRGIYRLPVERSHAKRGGDNAETVLYSSDYAVLAVLAASCLTEIDEPEEAARHLADAKRIRPDLAPLFDRALDPGSNVLVIVEAGQAPLKTRAGQRGELLVYRRAAGAEVGAVRIDEAPLDLGLTDDLYVQASTLGGRAVDELNRLKASRQDALHAAGLATTMAGSMAAAAASGHSGRGARHAEAAGLIAMGVGVAAMIFAETAVDPSADIRAWNLLPGTIYLAAGAAPPGEHQVEVSARGQFGGDQSQRWTRVPIQPGRKNLLWFRLLSSFHGGVYPEEGGRPLEEKPTPTPNEETRKET